MQPSEEIEDLTVFANESFDTDGVDLFEFTSEESSPVTQLKSIILSLDWEITDETLDELSDELQNLQNMWEDDKVAGVYLQGMHKIGRYIRTRGAHAHPNAIKLLLTFFYDFEKIIISQDISGDAITQLLKNDIRKFKILQYQINLSESNLAAEPQHEQEAVVPAPAMEGRTPLEQLQASVLGLDWEVTDASLVQFNDIIRQCREQLTDNKPASILLHGLEVLGAYIAESRANTHPEAFILLHAFNEGLKKLAQPDAYDLNQEGIQELLLDRVNRLNNLKAIIAGVAPEPELLEEAPGAAPVQPSPVEPSPVAEPVEPLAAELDALFQTDDKGTGQEADAGPMLGYPDEILPPDAIHPIDDTLPDDFIKDNLNDKRGLTPALANADGFGDIQPSDSTADATDDALLLNLESSLDAFFGTDEPETSLTAEEEQEPAPVAALFEEGEGQEPAEETGALEIESSLDAFFGTDEPETSLTAEEEQEPAPVAALFEEEDVQEPAEEISALEIESSLDAFFGADEPETSLTAEEEQELTPVAALFEEEDVQEPAEEISALKIESSLDAFFGTDEPETSLTAEEEQEPAPVAALFEEEEGQEPAEETGALEIESSLDAFFGTDEPETAPIAEEEQELAPVAALFEEEEEQEPAEEISALEIESSLDAFFATDEPEISLTAEEEQEPAPVAALFEEEEVQEPAEEISALEIKSSLDTLLGADELETLQPADLEESAEIEAPVPEIAEQEGHDQPEFIVPTVPEVADAGPSAHHPELEEALDAFFASEAAQQPLPSSGSDSAAERWTASLAELGILLPQAMRAPSRDTHAAVHQQLDSMRQAELSEEQRATVNLLDNVFTLMHRMPIGNAHTTENLVNQLYEQLLTNQPGSLPHAVQLFTGWLSEAATGTVAPDEQPEEKPDEADSAHHHTDGAAAATAGSDRAGRGIHAELTELRQYLSDELDKLRQEIRHSRH
ncbi:MAG: hypothetical protein ACOX5Z_11370 [Desulfobulbus sp.]